VSFLLRLCAFGFLVLVGLVLSGCAVVEYFKREGPPSDGELYGSYTEIELRATGAGEARAVIYDPEYELLSQSKSVITSFGQKKKGYKSWFNMVAFDETRLTANRKYFFLIDEKAKTVPFKSKRRLHFESRMVIESEVLDEPYVDRNVRRIAILKQVLANFRTDMDGVKADNKKLEEFGMLTNHVLETIMRDLDESPALASKLSGAEGVRFDHMTLEKGRIWMEVAEDIADVKVLIDSFVGPDDDPFDLDR
jgi:hypothetical protein